MVSEEDYLASPNTEHRKQPSRLLKVFAKQSAEGSDFFFVRVSK